MDIIKIIQNLTSPASKKQKAYKKEAKTRGLMSADQFLTLVQKDELNLNELHENPKFKLSAESVKLSADILKQADENGILKLSNVILYDGKNFHNLTITDGGYNFIASNHQLAVQDNPEFDCLNVGHQQEPEYAFGTYTINTCDKINCQLIGDVEMDINHPAFAVQKYALEQDPELQLGLSIEIGGKCEYNKMTKEIVYTEPVIMGLATTLIPSAPATLTNLEKPKKTTMAIAEIENDNTVEVYDNVLNSNGELMTIVEIITDSSFKYKDITCSEADPVAILYNYSYWDWENEGGMYDFANLSTLTKVKYKKDPNKLSSFVDQSSKSLIEFKQKLNIPLLETQINFLTKLSMDQEKPTPETNEEVATTTDTTVSTDSQVTSPEASEIQTLTARVTELEAMVQELASIIVTSTSQLSAVNKEVITLKKPSKLSTFSN